MKPNMTQKKMAPNVSICIDVEYGDIALYKTLHSVVIAAKEANIKDIDTEILLLLRSGKIDNVHRCVKAIREKYPDIQIEIINSETQDLDRASALNMLADRSNGTKILYVDDGDLIGAQYIVEAVSRSLQLKNIILTPKFQVSFEAEHLLRVQHDFSDMNHKDAVFDNDIYTTPPFYDASLNQERLRFVQCGDNKTVLRDWYMKMIAEGYTIKTEPNTIYFRRFRRDGIIDESEGHTNSLPPQVLFEPDIYLRVAGGNKSIPSTSRERVDYQKGLLPQLKSRLIRHHIMYHYAQVQWNLHKNVFKAVTQLFHGSVDNRVSSQEAFQEIAKGIPDRMLSIGINQSVVDVWADVNSIEPMVRPSWDMMKYIPIENTDEESVLGKLYAYFCNLHNKRNFPNIILVPHLVRGGADMAAINLARKLAESGEVLLITTSSLPSPWLSIVEQTHGVSVIDGSNVADIAGDKKLRHFIEVIAQNFRSHTISVINSEVGYRIARYDKNLLAAMNCRILLHTYAYDMTEDGYLFNWLQNGLVYAYEGVDKYITDSQTFARRLVDINGFNESMVKCLYLPIDSKIVSKKNYTKRGRILWASRVHNNKLIEILVEVADILSKYNIHIDMYGALDIEYERNDKLSHMIKGHNNLTYKGSYSGFSNLPLENYDMFLLTTKNEGMPNVLLEACMANLYTVAPDVGGIKEIINDTKNGRIVPFNRRFHAKEYADAILAGYLNEEYSDRDTIVACNKHIVKRHSCDAYEKSVRELYK